MATNFWICYEPPCNNYRGPESEFKHPEGGHVCPKCKTSDACFPWRKFRCLGCGFEETQAKFFAYGRRHGNIDEADLDADPITEKWEYECSRLNNEDCDSKSYEQIDDSTEPPKQKLYILRREERDGVWYFYEEESERAMTEIFFGSCPVGTRVAVQRKRFERSIICAQAYNVVLGTHAPIEAFQGDEFLLDRPDNVENGIGFGSSIKASNVKLDDFPWILLFLPRATWGERQTWTTDQWLESMTKPSFVEAVQAVKDEEQGQRDLVELEALFGNRKETTKYIIRHKDKKTVGEVLALAKKMFERRKAKKKKKKN